MKKLLTALFLVIALAISIAAAAEAQTKRFVVPKGTLVDLVFISAFTSRTAKVGDPVKLKVNGNVTVGGRRVINRGTTVTGTIKSVEGRGRYGVNAKVRLVLNPIRSNYGKRIPIEPRVKGDYLGGRTAEAAGATVGGAAVLGPVGLIGGYFVVGKTVTVQKGDPLATQVSKNVTLRAKK